MNKKYTPSAKVNNELKAEVLAEIKGVLYRLESGKFNSELDKDSVSKISSQLKCDVESFENSVGTGSEDVSKIYDVVKKNVAEFKKATDQEFMNHFERVSDDLDCSINMWKAVEDGETTYNESDEEKTRATYTRKRLDGRLAELDALKNEFIQNEKRIEKDITNIEKDLEELDEAIVKEENERRINELFRQISALKSKIDVLSVRKGNYSACYNTLDIVYSIAKEIVTASAYSSEDIGKAKALLNLDRLRKVMSDPDKAISILKRMKDDIKKISDKTMTLDDKVFGLNGDSAKVSDDARAYKEALMAKKRAKTVVAESVDEILSIVKEEIKEENN